MKKMLLSCCLALLCAISLTAQADWTCQQEGIDGSICGQVNPDGTGWCQYCGFDEPVHGMKVALSGKNFISLKWYGREDRPLMLCWCVSGTGELEMMEGIREDSCSVKNLQPGTSYDFWLYNDDFEELCTLTAKTSGGSEVTATEAPTSAPNFTPTPKPTATPTVKPTAKPTPTPKPTATPKSKSVSVATAKPQTQAASTVTTGPHGVSNPIYFSNTKELMDSLPTITDFKISGENLIVAFSQNIPKGTKLRCWYYQTAGGNNSVYVTTSAATKSVSFKLPKLNQNNSMCVEVPVDSSRWVLRSGLGDLACRYESVEIEYWRHNTKSKAFESPAFYFRAKNNQVVDWIHFEDGQLEYYNVYARDNTNQIVAGATIDSKGKLSWFDLYENGIEKETVYSNSSKYADYTWIPAAYPLGFGTIVSATPTPAPTAKQTANSAANGGIPTTGPHNVSNPIYFNTAAELLATLPKITGFKINGENLTVMFDQTIPKGTVISFTYGTTSSYRDETATLSADANGGTFKLPDLDTKNGIINVTVPVDSSHWVLRTSQGDLASYYTTSEAAYTYWIGQWESFSSPYLRFTVKNNQKVDYMILQNDAVEIYSVNARDSSGKIVAYAGITASGELSYVFPYVDGKMQDDPIYSDDSRISDYAWILAAYPLTF